MVPPSPLAKLCSLAYTDGFYYVPRIDRDQLLQYKEDLSVLTGGLFSEVPSLLLNVGDRWKRTMEVDN